MKVNKHVLNEEMKQALATLRGSSDALDPVIDTILSKAKSDPEATKDQRAMMQKPTWRLTAKTRIEGVLGGEVLFVEGECTFEIDAKTLISQVDTMAERSNQALESLKHLGEGKETSQEVMAVLLDSLYPRSWGTVVKCIVKNADGAVVETPTITGLVELVFREGLVHLQWAEVVSQALPNPYYVDEDVFSEACWVPLTVFTGDEPFEKEVVFEDNSNGEPVRVQVAMTFSPLP